MKISYYALMLLLFQGWLCIASDRLLIITPAFNEPTFIEWQCKMFAKFIKDEYEFVVFNDANNEKMAQRIQNVCNQCGVRCIRIPQEIHSKPYLKRERRELYHNPNVRQVNGIQYSLNTIGFKHDGIVVLIDSDMFVTRPLSFNEAMRGV